MKKTNAQTALKLDANYVYIERNKELGFEIHLFTFCTDISDSKDSELA